MERDSSASSRRDLHNALLCTVFALYSNLNFLSKKLRKLSRIFAKIARNLTIFFSEFRQISESEKVTADVCRAMRQGSAFRNFSPSLHASRMRSFSQQLRSAFLAALRDLNRHRGEDRGDDLVEEGVDHVVTSHEHPGPSLSIPLYIC